MKIKVIYDGKLDVELDEKIRHAMFGIGCDWYGQGKATDGYRDIAFDYEPPNNESQNTSDDNNGIYAEFDMVINCLELELPEEIYSVVSKKYLSLKRSVADKLNSKMNYA